MVEDTFVFETVEHSWRGQVSSDGVRCTFNGGNVLHRNCAMQITQASRLAGGRSKSWIR